RNCGTISATLNRESRIHCGCSCPASASMDGRSQFVELEQLARSSGEWLRGTGPESDIVISSRIRLARNLADFPFISRATPADRTEIGKILRGRIEKLHELGKFSGQLIYVDVSALEAVDRQFLVERQLIS